MVLESGWILKVEPAGLVDGLDMARERRESKTTPRIETALLEMKRNGRLGLFWKEFSFKC
jgi:hypothetical protein